MASVHCNKCGKNGRDGRIAFDDGDYVCDTCAIAAWRCDDCGGPDGGEGAHEGMNGLTVCRTCLEAEDTEAA